MGLTTITARIGKGKKATDVSFLVDSGATYSLLPESVWKKLGIKPSRELSFTLADGTVIKRKISETVFEIQGISGTSPVILGEGNDEALLGAITLEVLGLILNPFSRELSPMKMMLA
jgi:clan AA aspartic protease